MTDLPTARPAPLAGLWRRADKAVLAVLALLGAVAVFDAANLWPTVDFALRAFGRTAIFIVLAVLAVGWLKATGAENLLARAFEGREVRMIVLAALAGGLSPFCSCQVIPFIAALLAVGAPLSAVMAFWLSSPLMDPAMFLVTAGTLGMPFALGKTAAAVGLGLMGGFAVRAASGTRLLSDPLKASPVKSCCGSSCGASRPFSGRPVWRFWQERQRLRDFRAAVVENALFLGKWLFLAYVIEAMMLTYVPAEAIAAVVGGEGLAPIIIGAAVGAPAYLNGYAAVPLIDALLTQGMSQGAAMAFMVAGGVSSVPAAIAVWALVRPRIFATYMGLALAGATLAGMIWAAAS